MHRFLNRIRTSDINITARRKITHSILIFILGLAAGTAIKLLDIYTTNIGNIFSQLSVWVLICSMIAVYSAAPSRAAVNVFLFCTGMLTAYYITASVTGSVYSMAFVYGWALFSFCSPLFAFFTWYAKGRGWFAKILTAGIIVFMLLAAMVLFDKIRIYDILIAVLTIAVLYPKKEKGPTD